MTPKNHKAQSTIEFSLAFILAVLFLFLSCNLFIWFNRNVIQRQIAYENTRVIAGQGDKVVSIFGIINITTKKGDPGKTDFYEASGPNKNQNYKPLNVFVPGGYNK